MGFTYVKTDSPVVCAPLETHIRARVQYPVPQEGNWLGLGKTADKMNTFR